MTDISPDNTMYNNAVKHIRENFLFEEKPTYVFCPAEDHPQGFIGAEYSHVTTTANVTTTHYNIHWLMPSSVDIKNEFTDLLARNAVFEISNHFRLLESQDNANYLAELFQYFLHDGNITPHSISEINISEHPTSIFSEDIIKKYKQQCALYSQPTTPFAREYLNWKMQNYSVALSLNGQNSVAQRVTKNNLFLDEILKEEYATPLLQHLIKLRIIHLCLSEIDTPSLQEHPFFKQAALKNILGNLQQDIQSKINTITSLSIQERKTRASIHNSNNRYNLSPILQKISQHISFVKLINGHSFYDIHQLPSNQLLLSKKLKFYLKSYTNSSIIEYLAARTRKAFNKSMQTLRLFITGQEKIKALPFAFFNLLKSIYLTLWLPFLASYFVVSGLTSMPFSLLRKATGISFGGTKDKLLTGMEALKDIAILYTGLPLVFSLLETVGSSLLGENILAIGSFTVFYCSLVVIKPYLLDSLLNNLSSDTLSMTYVKNYYESNYSPKALKIIQAVSKNSFIFMAIHMSIAAATLVLFSVASIGGYALNYLKERFTPNKQCQKNDLMAHNRNINHSPILKKTLAELIKKLDANSCKSEDTELLCSLYEAQLNSDKKPLLINYLTQKVSDSNTPNKNVLAIANMQLKQNGAFLPSWKLINRLNTELKQEKETNLELQNEVERLYNLYTGPLAAYQ